VNDIGHHMENLWDRRLKMRAKQNKDCRGMCLNIFKIDIF